MQIPGNWGYKWLDNLKLGYGGTKSEMERLLEKAEELSGQEYDISNLSDVYNAIHVIQEDLGITGTTAKEAMYTIEGSAKMTKAAWDNVIVAIGKGEGLQEALNDLSTSIFGDGSEGSGWLNNVIPRIQTTFDSIGVMITELAPMISEKLPEVVGAVLPGLLSSAVALIASVGAALPGLLETLWTTAKTAVKTGISTLSDTIPTMLPKLISGFENMLKELGETLQTAFPEALNLLDAAVDIAVSLIENIATGIKDNLPTLLEQALPMIVSLTENIKNNAGELISAGLDLILSLAQGLMDSLPTLLANVPLIVSNIANIINENAPKVLVAGVKLIVTLASGLIKAIPSLIANLPKIINAIVDVFMAFQWINLGKTIIESLGKGIANAAKNAVKAVSDIVSKVKAAFAEGGWKNVGKNIINLLKNGVAAAKSGLVSNAKKIVSGVKSAFTGGGWKALGKKVLNTLKSGISAGKSTVVNSAKSVMNAIKEKFSVSLRTVGKNLLAGLWNGINDKVSWLKSKVSGVVDKIKSWFTGKSGFNTHSPSKWSEQVFNYVMEGGAKGLESGLPSLMNTVEGVTDAVKDGFVVEPTYSTTGLVSEASGGGTLSAFTESVSDTIASETSRIMEILSQYLPDCANTQLVMDTGTLVGQITPSIDAKLGTLAKQRARGY